MRTIHLARGDATPFCT